MAQHDYNLSNATGANFRADLNDMAQAIVTVNSGATEPSVRFPGMLWLDLSGGGDGVMRRRNQANSAWLTDIGIDQTARTAAAAAQTTANAAVVRAGDTMTGPLNLPAGTPTNNQAVSRAAADALYQVVLPTPQGGSLLIGAAGGWLGVLNPGANTNILSLSGGVPVWQATGTVAAPGVVVRTLPDGTIDSSFIPQVASGLKFCGTFKPAVNAEYPTTGGHGAGGVPAIGDFWVIDGLTTGGYTYLTGSLAGVTVFNGDSIAFNGSTNWYRMGNTINMQGYLRSDGTVAMAAPFNMGTFAINNVGGIAGRAGTPVPLTNFKIDQTNQVISPQRVSGADLAAMAAGQLGTDLGRMQIFVGAAASNTAMLPVTFFSETAAYDVGSFVWQGGRLWRNPAAVAAGTFVSTQWNQMVDNSSATFTGNVAVQGVLSAKSGSGSLARALVIGDGAAFWDTDFANVIALRGENNNTQGSLQFGTGPTVYNGDGSSITIGGRLIVNAYSTNGGTILFKGYSTFIDATIDRSSNAFRFSQAGGSQPFLMDTSSGAFTCPGGFFLSGDMSIATTGRDANILFPMTGRSLYFNASDSSKGFGLFDTGAANWRWRTTSDLNFYVIGTAYAAAFVPSSDETQKTDIQDLAPRVMLPELVRFRSFKWKRNDAPARGVIAQEVRAYAPQYVQEAGDDLLGVDYMGLTLECVLALTKRVQALEAFANIDPTATQH